MASGLKKSYSQKFHSVNFKRVANLVVRRAERATLFNLASFQSDVAVGPDF